MLKILLALLLMTSQAWATVAWRNGTGANTILGSSNASDIDTNSYNNIVSPLDSLLANYREGINITYSSASQVTVSSGSVTVSNSDGSIRLMLKNANSTTVTFSDLDTGAEGSSTTYYVYAIAASASSTSATFKISASSTSPSGVTYYKRIGYFLNDGSSNVTDIHNDNQYYESGTWASKSVSTTYQALTDGIVVCVINTGSSNNSYGYIYSDSSSSPTTLRAEVGSDGSVSGPNGVIGTLSSPVKKGDYYKVTVSGTASAIQGPYFLPLGS